MGIWFMFYMKINKLTITETHLLYGTYRLYRPVCFCAHNFSVMGKAFHMLHTGLIFPGEIMNSNPELPLDESYKRYD